MTTITAFCACAAFTLRVSLAASSLPYPRALCLCTSCRRVSGACGITSIRIPNTQTIDPSSFSLTSYSISDHLTRYFCSTCGAHVLSYLAESDCWGLSTGLCDRTEGVLQWTGCEWVEDTLDGGVSIWLNSITDADGSKRELQRWMLQGGEDGKNGELAPYEALRKFSAEPEKANARAEGEEERLKAQCHCGGVEFYITPPNEASKKAHSPFPDLMIPYHTGASSANPENKTWWLRANDTKYLAGTCTCRSCRLASGFEIQPWAFVPKCNISQQDGRPMDYSMGTLKRYASSEGVWREFCGRCGATVFWHCEERPELVDVSVGLLDPAEGARVERWLEWWPERVSFEEMAVSRSLVQSLEDGLRKWGGRNGGVS